MFTPTSGTISIDVNSITPGTSTLGMMIDDITITPQNQVINQTGLLCQGGTFTLNAPVTTDPNATYANYSWIGPNGFTGNTQSVTLQNVQPNQSGTYTCTMTLNGCLTVSGSIDVQITPSDFYITKSICNGSTYSFYGRTLYRNGNYDTLILNNAGGCDSFIHLNLIVNPLLDVTIKPNDNIGICEGDSMRFSVVNPDVSTTYQWIKDGGIITGEQGVSYFTGEVGKYYFSATTAQGCKDSSDAIKLDVFEKPVAQILSVADNDFCNNDTIKLSAYPQNDVNYFWEPAKVFRTIGVTDQQEVAGRFIEPITNVVLTVMSNHGCYASDTAQVQTHECCYLFVPNAFTPDGDLLNDEFLPKMKAGQLMVSMRVFDRWGKQVYDYNNNKKGWNGLYPNGTPANSGVYCYYIEYTCGIQKVLIQKGDITLIR